MPMSKRDKRKSEVLIAAQSLDQEVKHVKNLKRLSIGSMDLLMDPELEYRVSSRQGTGTATDQDTGTPYIATSSIKTETTKSEQGEQEYGNDDNQETQLSHSSLSEDDTTTAGAAVEEEDDSYSFTDDSMDVTNAEYLDKDAQANMINNNYRHEPLPRRRVLSGSISRSISGTSSTSDGNDESKHNESLGQNLLWVRADQHPNVKPENYLELVQNTLENMNLGGRSPTANETQAQSLSGLKTLRKRSMQSGNSLARRPSRLRTSYTELSEDDEDKGMTDQPLAAAAPTMSSRRTVSLKDITEELTKLSNQAGLTDTDAVTLARTLWVADESTTDSTGQGLSNNLADEEEEFASTMFTKSGFTVPARHSLRRSKFNTYRIQSSSSKEERIIETRSPSGSNNSPNSIIGLYNDEPFNEKKPIVQEFFSTLPASDDFESESSTEDAESSADFSNEVSSELETTDKQRINETSKSWRWSQSPTTSNDYQQAQYVPKENIAPLKINHSRNRHNIAATNSERNTSETSINTTGSAATVVTQTSIDTSSKETSNTQEIKPEKRRSASMNLDHDTTSIEVNDKKLKKGNHGQNKFMKFFKKRSSSASSGGKIFKESTTENLPSMPIERELKKKQSGSGLSNKFWISPKKQSKSESGKEEQLKHKDRIKFEYEKEKKQKEKRTKKKPSLQPAVTVVKSNRQVSGELGTVNYYADDKTKGNTHNQQSPSSFSKSNSNRTSDYEEDDVEVTEFSVHEDSFTSVHSNSSVNTFKDAILQTDHSQDSPYSGTSSTSSPSSPASPPAPMQIPSASTPPPPTQQQEQEQAQGTLENQYPLPPRKLTFADVLKPDRPNSPMKFTDSAFGFPLPPLTISTVIMFDHRLPIHVERAIYRLSHLKLSDPKRVLRQQVLLSNFMYAYLNLVNHSLYLQQIEEEHMGNNGSMNMGNSNALIDIPDM